MSSPKSPLTFRGAATLVGVLIAALAGLQTQVGRWVGPAIREVATEVAQKEIKTYDESMQEQRILRAQVFENSIDALAGSVDDLRQEIRLMRQGR